MEHQAGLSLQSDWARDQRGGSLTGGYTDSSTCAQADTPNGEHAGMDGST